jgi:flavin reductase (DIM6/NTAB) family NADH-FMN oxidoreductase RutF
MADILKCMDKITQGVYLIGTKHTDTCNFMTASFVTQISFNPCSLAISLDNTRFSKELIEKQGYFSVAVLADNQELEAKNCGYQSGRAVDKDKRIKHHLADYGLPIVEGATANMICKVKKTVLYEDHTIFIAEILSGEYTDKKALRYVSEDFFPSK